MTWLHGRRWRMLFLLISVVFWTASFLFVVGYANQSFAFSLQNSELTIQFGSVTLAYVKPQAPLIAFEPARPRLWPGFLVFDLRIQKADSIRLFGLLPTSLAPALALLLLLLPARRRPIRDHQLRCPACHHNLAPPVHLLCPECGWNHDGTARPSPSDSAATPSTKNDPHPPTREITN